MARILRFVQLMIITVAILLIAVLFSRAFVTLYRLLQRAFENLRVENWVDYTLATVLAVSLLYVVTWRLVIVRNVNNWLKSNVLSTSHVPDGQETGQKSGIASLVGCQSVLVYINGGWQPALVIERAVMGAYIVYVPHAPHAHSGDIYVLESFQVRPLTMSIRTMQDTIEHFGKGLSAHTGKLFETG